MKLILAFTLFTLGSAPFSASQKQSANNSASPILGDWHGTSLCLVKPSACHDEEALYHVKSAPDQPGKLSLQAERIADGKPVVMGPDADCNYDTKKKFLRCDFARGYVELTLKGDRLEGAMFLTDKTRWRELKLKRVKA